MPNIVITRSRRGIFDKKEWEIFAGEDGTTQDRRVFIRCRNPACWNIWTMTPDVFRVRSEDLENHPIECEECLNNVDDFGDPNPRDQRWDITCTWCNFVERPATWIGNIGSTQTIQKAIADNMKTVRDYRKDHDGMDPPHGTAAHIAHDFVKNHMWCGPGSNNARHYKELFHNHLPSRDGQWDYAKIATMYQKDPTHAKYPKDNKYFYRCILNMIIQTEFTTVGGSAPEGGTA